MTPQADPRKLHRQNRQPKTRFQIRWDDLNYDFLLAQSRERGISVAAIANEIIRRERLRVPRGNVETS